MIQDQLRDLLLVLPGARLTHGGKEITSRCDVCGDSSNPKHAHLVINLGYGDTPLFYNCVRCHRNRGLLTPEKLIQWGIYSIDPNLYTNLLLYNKKVLKYSKNKQFIDNPVYKVNNFYISDNKITKLKLNYINNRLGTDLDYNEVITKKIVLNLKDLLYSNHIDKLTMKDYVVNQLNNYFVGFLSEDNAFINLRCIIKNEENMDKVLEKRINRRYTQYSLFGKFDNTRNNYVIPMDLNILTTDNIKINIAEGQFDILSVYYNLRNRESNCVYSAISGNNYVSLCQHFLTLLGIPNIEFHIYIDNDINEWNIKAVERLCRNFNIPFFLHRNMYPGEKDFGVQIDRIKEQIQKIV